MLLDSAGTLQLLGKNKLFEVSDIQWRSNRSAVSAEHAAGALVHRSFHEHKTCTWVRLLEIPPPALLTFRRQPHCAQRVAASAPRAPEPPGRALEAYPTTP